MLTSAVGEKVLLWGRAFPLIMYSLHVHDLYLIASQKRGITVISCIAIKITQTGHIVHKDRPPIYDLSLNRRVVKMHV